MVGLGNKRQRQAGVLLLTVSVLMLVAGETILKARLDGRVFILYWASCFLFMFFAVLLALAELRTVRYQAREEQRELLKEALDHVQEEAEKKRNEPS